LLYSFSPDTNVFLLQGSIVIFAPSFLSANQAAVDEVVVAACINAGSDLKTKECL